MAYHRLSAPMVRRLRSRFASWPNWFVLRFDSTYKALVRRGLMDKGSELTELGVDVGRQLSRGLPWP